MPVPNRSNFGIGIVGAMGLFGYGFLVSWAGGVNVADESWFLRVVDRILSGEILYRDVFCGVTPASVYLTALVAAVLGAEILVVKGLVALCFALTVILSCRLARQLDCGPGGSALLVLALVVYTAPLLHAVYQPMANVFFVATFGAALCGIDRSAKQSGPGNDRSAIYALGGGLAAGLCFMTKQSIGAYALVAFVLSLAVRPSTTRRDFLRAAFYSGLAFGLVSAGMLGPVYLSGAAASLVDYGFVNKVTYVQTAGISYLSHLFLLPALLQTPSWAALRRFYVLAPYLLPPLVLGGALVVAWKERRERPTALTVFFFAGAAFLGLFPRVDPDHFIYAMPPLFIGTGYVWRRLKPALSKSWTVGTVIALIAWLGVGLFGQISKFGALATSADDFSRLPHFRAALIPAPQSALIEARARALIDEAANGPVFLLFPEAGFYYLITGLKNPTPFAYPLITAFGLDGQERTRAAIATGEIRSVCARFDSGYGASLEPRLLQDYVKKTLAAVKDLGLCTVHRR